MTNRRTLAAIRITSLLLVGVFLAGCVHNRQASPPQNQRPKIQEEVNKIPVSERVYTWLQFPQNRKYPVGKELELTIAEAKGAASIEYELEYQAGTLVQVAIGSISVKEETSPFSRTVLLGSCSAGGACSYSEDVKGGTILLRFRGSPIGNLKGEWNYYQPGNDGEFSSRDGKFQVEAAKLKNAFVIISQTLGLPASPAGRPKQVEGEVIAGPYHLETTSSSVGEITATIHLSKEGVAKLWHWDGGMYRELPGKVEGKTLTAKLKESGTYVVTE